jgi:CheY-like chemotaxis protein
VKEDGFAKLSVLVADDSAYARSILVAVLRAVGVRKIREAADGVEALEHFRLSSVDIVFTDVHMPVLDGVELIRMIRSQESSPNPYVPVIVLSAHTQRATINQCRNAGATEFIAKPITAAAVIRRLQVVIENPRPFIKSKQFFGPDRRRRNIDVVPEERRVE